MAPDTFAGRIHPDGGSPAMGALPFREGEVCPPEALVVWPRTARAAVVAEGGLAVSVPFFGELVRRWEAGGRDPEEATRQAALDLAAQIRRAWPSDQWAREQASTDGHGAALLDGLARLDDLAQRLVFLAEQVLAGAYGPGTTRPWPGCWGSCCRNGRGGC